MQSFYTMHIPICINNFLESIGKLISSEICRWWFNSAHLMKYCTNLWIAVNCGTLQTILDLKMQVGSKKHPLKLLFCKKWITIMIQIKYIVSDLRFSKYRTPSFSNKALLCHIKVQHVERVIYSFLLFNLKGIKNMVHNSSSSKKKVHTPYDFRCEKVEEIENDKSVFTLLPWLSTSTIVILLTQELCFCAGFQHPK